MAPFFSNTLFPTMVTKMILVNRHLHLPQSVTITYSQYVSNLVFKGFCPHRAVLQMVVEKLNHY